jgi:tetratricopeptide (TPR) repeat protein
MGDTAAARTHVQVLVSLKPQASPFEQAFIGWCEALVRGDVEAMIRHDRVGLGYAPHNNFSLFDLAQLLWETGRWREAVAPTREAMASGWRFAPLYALWGELAIEAGELSGLRDTLEDALSFATPDSHVAGLLEALALFDGDTGAARGYGAEFRAGMGAAAVGVGYAQLAGSFRTLAQRARERGKLTTALSLLRRAVNGRARQPIVRLELARVLAESGKRREAESHYRTAVQTELRDPETLLAAGSVAELLGRSGDARRDYSRYLEVAPDGPDAIRVRERLRVLGRPSGPP